MKLRQFVLAGLLSLLAIPAFGTTFYTGKLCSGGSAPPACSNSNNGTSLATAELTIAAGIAHLTPGDTLIIKAGTYHESIRYSEIAIPSGSPGNPITWMANPGDTVVIDGPECSSAPCGGAGHIAYMATDHEFIVNLYHHHDITIGPGLTFDGRYTEAGGCLGTDSCTGAQSLFTTNSVADGTFLEDLNIRIVGNRFVSSAINAIFINSVGVDVVNNEMDSNGFYPLEGPPYGYCIYDTSSGGIIEGNLCHHSGAYGFQFYSQAGYAHSNIIRNNIVHHNGIFKESGGMTVLGWNHQIYNNVIYSNSGPGIDTYATNTALGDVRIYHNTIYGQTDLPGWAFGYGITIGVQGNATNVQVANNIIRNNLQGSICQACVAGSASFITYAANNCQAAGTGCSTTVNPGFVDSGAGDFRINDDSSPVIDIGINVGINKDILNIDRPQGAGFDPGAYEFFGDVAPGPMRISVVTDAFTTGSDAALDAYAPLAWLNVYDAGSTNVLKVNAAADVVYGDGALGGNFIPWGGVRVESGLWSNNHASEITPGTMPSGSGLIGPACRMSRDLDGNLDWYDWAIVDAGGGNYSGFLRLLHNGMLVGNLDSATFAASAANKFSCAAIGSTIYGYMDTTIMAEADDATLPAGFPGMVATGTGPSSGSITFWEGSNFDNPEPPSGDITIQNPIFAITYSRPDNQQVAIEWATALTGNVDLQYGLNGCSGYMHNIATVPANPGAYTWNAAVPASATMVVNIKQGVISACSQEFTLQGQYVKFLL